MKGNDVATLRNNTDAALQCPPLHVMVPASGEVEISDDDAEKVNTTSGVWTVSSAVTRKQAVRGSKVAEVSAAPVMEKRG